MNGTLSGTNATFRVSTDRNLATRFDTQITLSAQSDTAAPETLRIYADTFRVYTATTAVGLTERFTISNTGAATFSSSVGVGNVTPYSILSLPSGTGWNGGLSWNFTSSGAASRRWWINTDQIEFGDFRICTEKTQGGGVISNASTLNERFYITSAGNVGIGTTAPTGRLTIQRSSSGAETDIDFLNEIGAGPKAKIRFGGTNEELSFWTGGTATERMRITSAGNVGIGTTAPGVPLHIIRSLGNDVIAIGETGSNQRLRIGQEASYTGNYINSTNIDFKLITYADGGSGGTIMFYTSTNSTPVERMRITSDGYLAATNTGTYRNIAAAQHSFRNNANSNNVIDVNHSGTSPYGILVSYSSVDPNNTTNYILSGYSYSSSTSLYTIWSNGTTSGRSDVRLKKNIIDSTPKLDKLMQLRVVNYEWKESIEGTKELGLIAQEVEEVFPNLVITEPIIKEREITLDDGTVEIEKYEDGDSKSLKNSVLPYITIKALQELTEEVRTLKAELDTLKNK
jgi:hypothetical protein